MRSSEKVNVNVNVHRIRNILTIFGQNLRTVTDGMLTYISIFSAKYSKYSESNNKKPTKREEKKCAQCAVLTIWPISMQINSEIKEIIIFILSVHLASLLTFIQYIWKSILAEMMIFLWHFPNIAVFTFYTAALMDNIPKYYHINSKPNTNTY